MNPKFRIGDLVIADQEEAQIAEILPPADSDFDRTCSYTVKWSSGEWGHSASKN